MKLRVPILNDSYRTVLADIERIMKMDGITKEVERIFNHYCEVVNSDEAAAILTLAEVLKCKEGRPDAKEDEAAGAG